MKLDQSQITPYKGCMRAYNWHVKDKKQKRKGSVMASFTAYAILGVEVELKKLTNTQMVRGCECELTAEQLQYTYCPKCRALIQEEQDVPIDGYIEGETLFGMDIVFNTDNERAYVGQIKSAEEEERGIPDSFYPIPKNNIIFQLKEQLKEKLGDLYDAEKFGMYVVIHCAY